MSDTTDQPVPEPEEPEVLAEPDETADVPEGEQTHEAIPDEPDEEPYEAPDVGTLQNPEAQ